MNATQEKLATLKINPEDHFKLKEMALYQRLSIKGLISKLVRENTEKLKQA